MSLYYSTGTLKREHKQWTCWAEESGESVEEEILPLRYCRRRLTSPRATSVKTEEGSLIIAGDAVNMIENLSYNLPSGITTSGEEYVESMNISSGGTAIMSSEVTTWASMLSNLIHSPP